MDYELDEMMGLDQLDLYYEAHVADIEGECFNYSVYFDNAVTDEKFEEIKKAIFAFLRPYRDKDIYMGYLDITPDEDKIEIYLDLGNVQPEYEQISINGILEALNNVSGIRSVIINE